MFGRKEQQQTPPSLEDLAVNAFRAEIEYGEGLAAGENAFVLGDLHKAVCITRARYERARESMH
jgi:hypothetical protein